MEKFQHKNGEDRDRQGDDESPSDGSQRWKIHFDELIEPTVVAILDNAREIGLNILNNAKKNMIDNFLSIKWLFHEIEELKEKMSQEEG